MATPRSATTVHKRMRVRTLARDRAAGVTHCPSCKIELDYDTPDRANPAKAEADEIVPYSVRGYTSTDPDDWQTLCSRCNQSKGAKTTPTATTVDPLASREWPHSIAW